MTRFNDISLRAKLMLNFLLSGGVLIAAIVFCLFQIRSVGQATAEIASNWLPSVQEAAGISQLRLRYRVRSLELMLAGDDAEREKIEKSLNSLDASLAEALKKYEPLISSEEERKIYQAAVAAVAAYRSTVQEAVTLAKAGNMDGAQNLRRTTWVKAADEVRDHVDALVKLNRSGSEKAAEEADKDVGSAMNMGLLALLAGVVVAVAATVMIARTLSRRLSESVDRDAAVAASRNAGDTGRRRFDFVLLDGFAWLGKADGRVGERAEFGRLGDRGECGRGHGVDQPRFREHWRGGAVCPGFGSEGAGRA